MHSPSRGIAPALLAILALLSYKGAFSLRAQEIQPPPDLWNIATGDLIHGADTLKTTDFGAIVDGMRIFGWREFQLARFRILLTKAPYAEFVVLKGLPSQTPSRDLPENEDQTGDKNSGN